MAKKTPVPDAWEDDWEAQADRAAREEAENPTPAPVLTRAERLAEHAESNRRLWQSAEANETFHYVEASNPIPLAAAFKPQVKVLSRKPVIARRGDPSTALGHLSLDDDDNDDNDAKKRAPLSPQEIRAKQKRDREEKQRKYDETRAKIFGGSAPSSRGSSPGNGTTTPLSPYPSSATHQQYQQQQPQPQPQTQTQQHSKARGRAGGSGGRAASTAMAKMMDHNRLPSDGHRAAPQASSGKQLYDPNYAPKPDSGAQRRDDNTDHSNSRQQSRDQGVPIRVPRGPDGTGRGGFGFARRGAKEA